MGPTASCSFFLVLVFLMTALSPSAKRAGGEPALFEVLSTLEPVDIVEDRGYAAVQLFRDLFVCSSRPSFLDGAPFAIAQTLETFTHHELLLKKVVMPTAVSLFVEADQPL